MGTAEQKQHRADYINKIQNAWDAGSRGEWTTDDQLRQYLDSQGIKGNPIFNQLYSQGGYSMYGPSWDPGRNFDFNAKQNIPYMGEGETWYDPSVASNWQDTPQLQSDRMSGFFNWRDQNADMINKNFGGNALAAWLQLRAKSNMPNAPDMSWWNEGNRGMGPPQPGQQQAAAPPQTGSMWDWLYGNKTSTQAADLSNPEARLKALISGQIDPKALGLDLSPLAKLSASNPELGNATGFDPNAWDRAFNPESRYANAEPAPVAPAPVKPSPYPPKPKVPINPKPSFDQPLAGLGGQYNPQANALINTNTSTPMTNKMTSGNNNPYVNPTTSRQASPARPTYWQAAQQGYKGSNMNHSPRQRAGLIGLGGY